MGYTIAANCFRPKTQKYILTFDDWLYFLEVINKAKWEHKNTDGFIALSTYVGEQGNFNSKLPLSENECSVSREKSTNTDAKLIYDALKFKNLLFYKDRNTVA